MRERQRELGEQGDSVIEGRDIGVVVVAGRRGEGVARRRPGGARAPPARRADGIGADELAAELRRRDERDAANTHRAADAVEIDTTELERSTRWSSGSWRSSRSAPVSAADVTWAIGRADARHAGEARGSRLKVYGKERVPLRRAASSSRQPLLAGSTLPRSAPRAPRTIYYMAKVEAHRVPGLGALIRAFGCFPVRRGESDREAVRTMRQVVREGSRSACSSRARGSARRPGRGAAGRGDGRAPGGRPDRPGRRSTGSQTWKPGNFQPVSIAWGEPMTFDGLPSGGKGYKEASLLRRGARSARSGTGSSRCTRSGRPATECRPGGPPDADRSGLAAIPTPTRARSRGHGRRSSASRTSASRRSSTGSPRRAPRSCTRRPASRATARSCSASGTAHVPADRHGRRRRGGPGPYGPQIADQARAAVAEADLVLFVVDARAGITPGDEELAAILRDAGKPVIVVANKIDDPRRDLEALEFHRLGLGDPVPLSALHGHGTGDLLDEIVARLPGAGEPAVGDEAIRVAILGRPNVGKSSLLNALLGDERVIVSEVPGHDARRDRHGAEPRRHARSCSSTPPGCGASAHQRQGIEYYSELRALEAAERADVALVLVDASRGRRRAGPRRRRRRPQGGLLDARRALEVGRRRRSTCRRRKGTSTAGCASGRP